MTPLQLHLELYRKGYVPLLDEGRLVIAGGDGAPPEELKTIVEEHAAALVAHLRAHGYDVLPDRCTRSLQAVPWLKRPRTTFGLDGATRLACCAGASGRALGRASSVRAVSPWRTPYGYARPLQRDRRGDGLPIC